ncbi:hypothetical protein QQS21_004124 [Conoideocrella luteorostrata]|uniref:AA1-like domain-containing protein n=1 Tax=Conoideocrella luteorostrata TaxID=1105319 RepID=A0AAJ0CRW3_9HYPO|nr:hypothetical protein QQS21_004124 [Conoideocrella luteorostrata]
MLYYTLATILVAGSAVAAPTPGSCTDRSFHNTIVQIRDFNFHANTYHTTPAHANVNSDVSFKISNPNAAYTALCHASGGILGTYYDGSLNYDCDIPLGRRAAESASFNFNYPTGELRINQTWACSGENSRFFAVGSVKLPLKCDKEEYQNPHWHEGEIYSNQTITCGELQADAKIEIKAAFI